MKHKKDWFEIWYVPKFDETHLIRRFHWNKYMAATCIEFPDFDDWVTITWDWWEKDSVYICEF